jgi:hypothetical protein
MDTQLGPMNHVLGRIVLGEFLSIEQSIDLF